MVTLALLASCNRNVISNNTNTNSGTTRDWNKLSVLAMGLLTLMLSPKYSEILINAKLKLSRGRAYAGKIRSLDKKITTFKKEVMLSIEMNGDKLSYG